MRVKQPPPRRANRPWPTFAALVVVTVLAYAPAWHGGVLWDDDAHITKGALQSVEGLWRIWFEVGATQQYYPVLHSAFWLLHRVFGNETLGYHLVSAGLHGLSACLFVVLLRRLRVPGALLAGVVFALHPIHVESVAWMTELKNTLSGVWYLLAALVYLRFDAERRWQRHALALALFVLTTWRWSWGTRGSRWACWWTRSSRIANRFGSIQTMPACTPTWAARWAVRPSHSRLKPSASYVQPPNGGHGFSPCRTPRGTPRSPRRSSPARSA